MSLRVLLHKRAGGPDEADPPGGRLPRVLGSARQRQWRVFSP